MRWLGGKSRFAIEISKFASKSRDLLERCAAAPDPER
jgi:hypothetical protein